jgi:hypothetical protein
MSCIFLLMSNFDLAERKTTLQTDSPTAARQLPLVA